MKIADPGWRFIALGLVVGGLGAAFPPLQGVGGAVAFLGFGFAAFSAYFFRDPQRPLPQDPTKIYSPGDGVVLSVAREGEGQTVTLRIFLSVFDVHIQRAPCSGTVESVKYHKGSFLAAMKDEARGNERSVMNIKTASGAVLGVEQIAGLVARRIECWAKPGDPLQAGARYGIIHFGSQAAVHFPESARCTVKPGDRVYAGLTPVGEWTA